MKGTTETTDEIDASRVRGTRRPTSDQLLPQLVAHLREHRERSCGTSGPRRIRDAHLLEAMTPQEMSAETTSVYDNYVEVLETGSVEALQHYARDLSERIIPRGVETHEVVGIVLLLRDVLARSLFEKYQRDFALLNQVLDAYEPAANRIANTVAVSFVDERERVIRQQQDAIRELSTPVLPVRERLLILPIIGVLDSERARQLTEQLLSGIRTHRAKVVVIDITGAPDVDETVANHLVQTVDASRLMGASVIITGLSPDDRPDARDDRRGPEQDEHHRRPPGWPRGGRAAARLPRDADRGARRLVNSGPALVSILRQGDTLVASIHTALDDSEMIRFQNDLIEQIGEHRARGVIIDVAALDVLDSFGSRTLRTIAEMARLRGAVTVIVGIQPDVAYAMVRLGMGMGTVATALDLEEGLAYLSRLRDTSPAVAAAPPWMTSRRLTRDYRAAFLRYLPKRSEGPRRPVTGSVAGPSRRA